jgi:hypothetical protein
MGRLQLNSNLSKNNRISIKKQNLTKLKPYSINGNQLYDSDALYVFKGGTTNTISTVFNYLELKTTGLSSSSDQIKIVNPNTGGTVSYWYRSTTSIGWRTTANITTDVADTVILTNSIIYVALDESTYKEISVGGDAIIQIKEK